jgi:hypothetical protein
VLAADRAGVFEFTHGRCKGKHFTFAPRRQSGFFKRFNAKGKTTKARGENEKALRLGVFACLR